MAFSTFVFDTLDICMRLGRYIVQELLGWKGARGALAGTLVTVAVPVYLLSFGGPGLWSKFWTLFGASNQLLAALTLLAITLWLHQARRRIAFTLVPMLFVLTITLWALGKLAIANLEAAQGFDVAAGQRAGGDGADRAGALPRQLGAAARAGGATCGGAAGTGGVRRTRRGTADVRRRFRVCLSASCAVLLSALAAAAPTPAARRVARGEPRRGGPADRATCGEAIYFWRDVFAELALAQPLVEGGVPRSTPAGARALENFAWQISRLAGRLPDGARWTVAAARAPRPRR